MATQVYDALNVIGPARYPARGRVIFVLCTMIDATLELLKLAGVGLIAGLFSSFLANQDHRQRKWWELRVSAYQNAIEALSDLVYYYDKHFNAEIEYRELPKEFKAKLDAYWEQAFPKVRKFADSGAFLFSEKANAALQELMKYEHEPTYMEHLDSNLAKARKCLSQLVECSKIDLKLRSGWSERMF